MITAYDIEQGLNDKQKKQYREYLDTHFCEEFKTGAGGFGSTSKVRWLVGSCSIGPTLEIMCPYCKEITDLTDIDTW